MGSTYLEMQITEFSLCWMVYYLVGTLPSSSSVPTKIDRLFIVNNKPKFVKVGLIVASLASARISYRWSENSSGWSTGGAVGGTNIGTKGDCSARRGL